MGFWIAVAAGLLALVELPASPLVSLADAGLFLGVAWGIRRGKWWAAVAGAYLFLLPALAVAMWSEQPFALVALALAMLVTAAFFLLRAAAQLRAISPQGAAWPWVALLCVLTPAVLLLRPMVLPTASMADTLQAGDRFFIETLTCRLGHGPADGDLIVFHYPPDRRQIFVKRVVGVPGDRIRVEGKVLYRNGRAVSEPYARHTSEVPAGTDEVVVPEGHYFVLGDNRDNSLDSRHWGFVPRADIIGRPLVRYSSNTPGGKWPKLLTRS